MDHHFVTLAYHVVEGIATGGEQVTVSGRIDGAEFAVGAQWLIGKSPRCGNVGLISEFVPPPHGKFPGVLGRRAMAVRTLDLRVGQQRSGDVSVAVHGGGGVTVLA